MERMKACQPLSIAPHLSRVIPYRARHWSPMEYLASEGFVPKTLAEIGPKSGSIPGAHIRQWYYNVERPHFRAGMEGRTPMERLRELGLDLPDEFACFPVVLLDEVAVIWASEGGHDVLAYYTSPQSEGKGPRPLRVLPRPPHLGHRLGFYSHGLGHLPVRGPLGEEGKDEIELLI